jgi:CRP/FNR family transcriptional regulator
MIILDTCNCSELFNKYFPFWDSLTPGEKSRLCNAVTENTYVKDSHVHGGDGRCTGSIVVKEGTLRVYIMSKEGREITLYRLFPGDMCMFTAPCVLSTISFDVLVDAEKDSSVYIIDGKTFAEMADRNLRIKNFALETAVRRFSEIVWVLQQILFYSFDKRLAIFLLNEMNNAKSDHIEMTHEQIAKDLGSAREVVTRMLKYFASENIIRTTRGGIIVTDPEKLKVLSKH